MHGNVEVHLDSINTTINVSKGIRNIMALSDKVSFVREILRKYYDKIIFILPHNRSELACVRNKESIIRSISYEIYDKFLFGKSKEEIKKTFDDLFSGENQVVIKFLNDGQLLFGCRFLEISSGISGKL